MAGLTPGPPVGRELSLQIGDLRGPEPHEDGETHAARRRKRLVAGGGHADRRMRHLIRTGHDRRVLDPIELSLVAERLSLPAQADDLQRLAKARLALAVRHAKDVIGAHDAAAPDSELEAALADVTSSAMRSGWLRGRTWTAVPTRRRRVRLAIDPATWSDAEITERTGVKWISPSHTQSTPHASARSASSKMSRKADGWLTP
jgi:hypothetical protein